MSDAIDRKAPCPCGSGRRYKSCCQAKDRARAERQAVAAEGHALVDEVVRVLLPLVESRGEHRVACARGCNQCCLYFIRTSAPEADAIAAFLARPEQAGTRARFEERLPAWRAAVAGPVDDLERLFTKHGGAPDDDLDRVRFDTAIQAYEKREAMCPFNGDDGGCTIYATRPVSCRAWIVVDSAAECAPSSPVEPRTVRLPQLDEAIGDARGRFERSRRRSGARPDGALPILVAAALARLDAEAAT